VTRRLLFILLALCIAAPAVAGRKKQQLSSEQRIDQASALILGAALTGDRAWEDLVHLCDRIGHRLSGSASLEAAIAWAKSRLEEDGLAVTLESVQVPKWVRGAESAAMITPVARPLPVLGLGMTVGTPPGGVEADVLVVSSWDELAARAADVPGRIVLFDVPFTSYGPTVQYRGRGATEAGKLGAVAALVRSVTPESLSTPHTGALRYDEAVPAIPAAALTVEDAETLHRLQDRGVTPRVKLELGAVHHGDVESFNVIAEVPGRESPDEVVLLGCHIDSWDVGQGAQDDGAGCVMVMESLRLIAALPWAPKRTVRGVLFTNEENGLRGGKAYHAAHGAEDHVAALEADTGAGQPLGWRLDLRGEEGDALTAEQAAVMGSLAGLQERLAPLGATGLRLAYSGADIGPIVKDGTPGFGVDFDTTGYWPIHHTEADTIDKIDPVLLNRNVAVMALTAFTLAEMDGRLRPKNTP
jgi:carboxypeptidase Q